MQSKLLPLTQRDPEDRLGDALISAAHRDHEMSGVLDETYDARGRVETATLLLRPLSALLDAITAMRAALEQSPLPSTLAAHTVDDALD